MPNNSKTKNNGFYYLSTLIVLALLIITFFFGYYVGKQKSNKLEKHIYEYDIDTIKITTPAKLTKPDTIKIKDSVIVIEDTSFFVAELDTTFTDSLSLQVKYYSPPINLFDINYSLPKRKEIITKYEYLEPSRFNISIGSGILYGRKGLDYGIFLGISYNLKSIP